MATIRLRVGFSCLSALHLGDFQWVELVVIRKRGLWKGFLFRSSVWVVHQNNLLHRLLRFVILILPSYPFVWFRNFDANSKGFVYYLMCCFFDMVHLFARMGLGRCFSLLFGSLRLACRRVKSLMVDIFKLYLMDIALQVCPLPMDNLVLAYLTCL
ncbi:hypothetical protein V6N13_124273 [Hibiscus sabdariffa]